MSLPFENERLASLRDEARTLVRRAGDHEHDLEALASAAEADVRHAEAGLSDALDVTHGCVEHLRSLLCTHLQRSLDGAEAARQLCAGARDQRVAAHHLLTQLSPDPRMNCSLPELPPTRDSVLVVDDYGDVRDVVAFVLKNAGFVVRTAANGLEGLLAAHEMRPGVIVMDVSMPVLDGIEATRLIKATDSTRNARVIAYTGNPGMDDRLVEQLFAAVLQKPATPAVLLATVQHVAGL